MPLPRTPKAQRVVGGVGAGLSGSILNRLLPIAPRQPRAPRGPLGGSGPVKPGGPEGGDAVSSESDKKNHRPGFLPPEFERSATAVDNGRRRWPNPSLQALVPMDLPVEKFFLHQHTRSTQDRLNKNLPHRHFRSSEGGLRTQNRGEDLESSLRGAPT